MGAARHFFDNKEVDKRIKSQNYVAGPLNALLWGCESWNITKNNLRKLAAFHHRAIRRILGIKWSQVREQNIKNKEVRGLLWKIPNIYAFIYQRTATYIGKIIRESTSTSYPKMFLAAWINNHKKPGATQLTCNNNFANALSKILLPNFQVSKQAPLCEWIPLAQDRNNRKNFIENYFKSCRNVDYEDITDSANDDQSN